MLINREKCSSEITRSSVGGNIFKSKLMFFYHIKIYSQKYKPAEENFDQQKLRGVTRSHAKSLFYLAEPSDMWSVYVKSVFPSRTINAFSLVCVKRIFWKNLKLV